jgi:hypothetical protein
MNVFEVSVLPFFSIGGSFFSKISHSLSFFNFFELLSKEVSFHWKSFKNQFSKICKYKLILKIR